MILQFSTGPLLAKKQPREPDCSLGLFFDAIKTMQKILIVSWNYFKNSTLINIRHFHGAINP